MTAFLHAVFPTHWLPFALVARAQRWGPGRVAAVAGAAAAGHALVTAVVGFGVAFAGAGLAERLEATERLGGGVLIGFGILYAAFDLRHVGHRHVHHVHDGHVHDAAHHEAALSDRAAIASLVLLLSVSPCIALTPVFFSAGAQAGLRGAGLIAAVNAAVTIPLMTGMTLLAAKGLSFVRLERLESKERLIVGALLAGIGLAVIFLHHEHPGA